MDKSKRRPAPWLIKALKEKPRPQQEKVEQEEVEQEEDPEPDECGT